MPPTDLPKIALLWSQFAAYHVDRCDAVAERLQGRAEVLAIEVASSSQTYAWAPSGDLAKARKLTLFPDQEYESISPLRRLAAQFRAMRRCQMALIGIPYNRPEIIFLSWLLWLWGVRVILMSESKFDDYGRSLLTEIAKSIALVPYRAAVVGGRRHASYLRFLGFRRRPVLPGYDAVSMDRVRGQAGETAMDHANRPFIFVGRFVAKKNLIELIEAYALYAGRAGKDARKLVLVGSGPLDDALRARAGELGLADRVEFPGFLSSEDVSRRLGAALALLLVSTVEQWGLVVNEALALGLPVIVSSQAGSSDALVRNLVNGYVVETGSIEGLARAMNLLASDEALWTNLSQGSLSRAWLGDTGRLADAVDVLFAPDAPASSERIARFVAELGPEPVKGES
jgi:glycosyltransferase involved in cell wall biosynthesis